MSAFIRFPWATSGDKVDVPATTQPSGDVSLQEGYGEDYSRDIRSDPDAKAVERNKFNGFLNLFSSGLRYLQISGGVPEFITTADNGGSAFAYGIGVRVKYDNGTTVETYQSRKNNNTSLPTVTDDWFVVNPNNGVPDGQIVNNSVAANAAIDAAKIANGQVSNAEFQTLDGVTSAIQTQLNGKQASGSYITQLTGEVTATGPGVVVAALSTTGVTAGSYYNANVQVDSKGRIVTASSGANAFGLLEGFETWSGGLPNTLPWTSPNTTNISQSALHVTQGTSSLAFGGTAEINVAGQNLAPFGEIDLDVFVGTAPAGSSVRITVGASTVQTTVATTGTFKLRCPVPAGATTIKIESVLGSIAWIDNLQYVVLVSATGVTFDPSTTGLIATTVQAAIAEVLTKSIPIGLPIPWAANSVPTGFLKMNGAAVSRTTYAALFAVLGTTWGVGNGTTTFNLPDWRGEFIRGFDDGRGKDTGRVFAALQTDAFQGHTFGQINRDYILGGYNESALAPNGTAVSNYGRSFSINRAVSAGLAFIIKEDGTNGTPRVAVETRPTNQTALWIIKY